MQNAPNPETYILPVPALNQTQDRWYSKRMHLALGHVCRQTAMSSLVTQKRV